MQFTCEGWDYFEFLGANAPNRLLDLYRRFISPQVAQADLMRNGRYDILNRWNTRDGAMHLTEPANNLGAEVQLAADATVRRRNPAGPRSSPPFRSPGAPGSAMTAATATPPSERRSTRWPARAAASRWPTRWACTSTGSTIPASGCPTAPGPPAGSGPSEAPPASRCGPCSSRQPVRRSRVSDVRIGGVPITFGGQIAQHITMKLTGVASLATDAAVAPIPCIGGAGLATATGAAAAPADDDDVPTRGLAP